MGRFIVKIVDEKFDRDYYMEWSTIVDAPVTYGCDLNTFKAYYQKTYGEAEMDKWPELLERLDKSGTSSVIYEGIQTCYDFNRAGENEEQLDKEGLLNMYCRNSKFYKS